MKNENLKTPCAAMFHEPLVELDLDLDFYVEPAAEPVTAQVETK